MIFGGLFDLENKIKRKEELEVIINSSEFWSNNDRETILKENNSLNEIINDVMYSKNKTENNINILAEEIDEEMLELICLEYDELYKLVNKLRINTYLSGEFD